MSNSFSQKEIRVLPYSISSLGDKKTKVLVALELAAG
jgi:hypothetical protein